MAYGKSIELFLVNGTADSLVTAELSNWNGKAIKIPRIEVSEAKRSELMGPGVYLLFCKEEGKSDSVYIGEAENVQDRLIQHMRDYQADKEKYYWTTAVIFVGRDLNKAHIRYLENRFVEIARECKRYDILTKNTYKNTVMKESQIAVMEEFVANVRVLINALGYKVFEPMVQQDVSKTEKEVLCINTGGLSAKGVVTTEGFVVLAGSTVNEKTSTKSLSSGVVKLREKMFKDGKIDNLKTTEDLLFSSSSAAAGFLLGYSVSGPGTWKNSSGITLKDLENR